MSKEAFWFGIFLLVMLFATGCQRNTRMYDIPEQPVREKSCPYKQECPKCSDAPSVRTPVGALVGLPACNRGHDLVRAEFLDKEGKTHGLVDFYIYMDNTDSSVCVEKKEK